MKHGKWLTIVALFWTIIHFKDGRTETLEDLDCGTGLEEKVLYCREALLGPAKEPRSYMLENINSWEKKYNS